MPRPDAATPTFTVAVSIINYRTADLTIQCAQSALDDMTGIDGVVVIVDNASGDGSVVKLSAWIETLPDPGAVRLVRSETNSGFSGGHNQGIAAARADFYLVLNSDAVLKPGFFRAILAAAGRHPEAGLFTPRLDYDDGGQQVSCFRYHSPASELIRGAASGPVTRALKRYDVPLDMPPDPNEIEWASFACILIRREAIETIGPMDEGYFLYFEDTEYCWRARRAGWKIRYVPDARAMHLQGGSGPVVAKTRERKRLPSYYYQSRSRYFFQTRGWAGLVLANIGWHLGRLLALSRVFLFKPVPPAMNREAQDIWTNITHPLGKGATGKKPADLARSEP